jgi:hypothetical protein
MNYEDDVKIDETALDIECLEQPNLMLKYARHSARMIIALDQAKQDLDITKAEVDKEIREDPEAYGVKKVTEGSIQSAILTEDRYKEAFQKYLDAKFEAEMAKGAVRAFEQRKDMLEALIKLHGQQYFAGPRVPRDLSAQRNLQSKKVDQGIGSRLRRNN